jgi:hypothetical protein
MLARSLFTILTLAAAVTAVQLPAMAQDKPIANPAAAVDNDVPVTRVALFSSGVGYFEHFGKVTGNGTTVIRFKTDQINDVLKSLVLQDLDKGSVSVVRYPSQDPTGRALKGFQVDVTGDTSMGSLLTQLRGAKVAITSAGEQIEGTVLSVEQRERPAGQTMAKIKIVNVLTAKGLRSLVIDDCQAIQFLDAQLNEELSKSLEVLAAARDKDKKNVSIDFKGEGQRRVRVGYVVETPVWKTSYRLVVDDKEAKLQGWAIVENQTDNDWDKINLSLVSGRPLSFTMDLYEPMYLARPEAELEMFEGLKPQTYAEAREEVSKDAMGGRSRGFAEGEVARKAMRAPGAPPAMAAAAPMAYEPGALANIDVSSSVTAQATSGQIGELFEYVVTDVNLPRQSSAMIPIITDPISVEKISIYNAGVLARHPLSGARVKNTTGKNLLQGPITVFEQGGYAGDAQINNVGPDQQRLISYGIDLQVLVDSTKVSQTSAVQSGKIVRGTIELQTKLINTHTYAIENKSDRAKTIVLEHGRLQNWSLLDTDKPAEETDSIYRFEVKIDPKKASEFTVKQQIVTGSQLAIVNCDDNTLLVYSNTDGIPKSVRDALAGVFKKRQAISEQEQGIQRVNLQINAINTEQTRIRENMNTVDRTSQYYGRLMTKLNEQETALEKLQTDLDAKQSAVTALRQELDAMVSALSVE